MVTGYSSYQCWFHYVGHKLRCTSANTKHCSRYRVTGELLMKMEIPKMSKKKRKIAALTILVIAIAVGAIYISQPKTDLKSNSISHNGNGVAQLVPPPSPLSGWGYQVSSFDDAKSITGVSDQPPTYMPDNLQLSSILVRNTSPVKLITTVYAPGGISIDSATTFAKVIDNV